MKKGVRRGDVLEVEIETLTPLFFLAAGKSE